MRMSSSWICVRSFRQLGPIGPEHCISEAFALEFTRAFHVNLLKIGKVGVALLGTRGFFAMKHNDPVSVFGKLHANPDHQLSETMDSVNL